MQRARRAALGYVYWLQTECPREGEPERKGYPEFKLRKDLFGTYDGLAPHPYIRESRRIAALETVVEQDVSARHQPGPRARLFPSSCGVGDFFMDVHPGRDDPERFFLTRPYQIPVDALIPVRVRNLLAACKNIGSTHLTNGCYRVHSVEWNVGESAGMLAAYCIEQGVEPSVMHENASHLRSYQRTLVRAGIPLFWWSDVEYGHPAYEAIHMLGVLGVLAEGATDLRFRPEERLDPTQADQWSRFVGHALSTTESLTRAEAAVRLYQTVEVRSPHLPPVGSFPTPGAGGANG
jgi:hypothetical protein